MPQYYDLHTHSTASDGSLSPAALVQLAHARGIDVLALTDHDVVDGLAEAAQAAAAAGLAFAPGVEISVTWGHQTIHVVGLNIDPDNGVLRTGLDRLCAFRHWRAEEIARRLAKKNIEGALEGARRYAAGNIIGRTHFARYLLEQGYAKDMKHVFKHYLIRNKPGYVPGEWAGLEEALGWIRAAGGQAVIAHPARYRISATRLRQLIGEFRELGGHALEVVSGSHSKDDIMRMAQLSSYFVLHASAGSDYHGPENPYLDLGRLPSLPNSCAPLWQHPSWPRSSREAQSAEIDIEADI